MNTAPLVSILINNYNYARFLPVAIESALDQSWPSVEVIVVDDLSTDDSLQVLEAYKDKVQVASRTENGGQAGCLNTGIPLCRGEVICMLDADDVFHRDKVAVVVAAFQQNPQAIMACHYARTVDAEGGDMGVRLPQHLGGGDMRGLVYRCGGQWPRPSMTNVAFRREFLEKLLPLPTYPLRLNCDGYINTIAAVMGPIAKIDAVLADYRVHGANKWTRADRLGFQRRAVAEEVFSIERVIYYVNRHLTWAGYPALDLQRHPRYLHRLYMLDHVSLWRVIWTLLTERNDYSLLTALRRLWKTWRLKRRYVAKA